MEVELCHMYIACLVLENFHQVVSNISMLYSDTLIENLLKVLLRGNKNGYMYRTIQREGDHSTNIN